MAFPADRFTPNTGDDLLPLKVPAALTQTRRNGASTSSAGSGDEASPGMAETVATPTIASSWDGGPVEFDRVVPPSGNLGVAGKQFWLGPARSGVTVTFWADTDIIHLSIAGTRIKSIRSHLSVTDLEVLARTGGRPAGPSPLPLTPTGAPIPAVEVDRTVSAFGSVSLGQHAVLAAEILAGRRVSIRVEAKTLMFFDPDTRQLLRTRPNPLTGQEILRLQTQRPAGPPPQPAIEPVTVQRRVSATGTIMVAWQKITLGRVHAGKTVTVRVGDTELAIECDDGIRTVRRTNHKPVTRIKAHRPRKVEQNIKAKCQATGGTETSSMWWD
jgi:hypothetical protein